MLAFLGVRALRGSLPVFGAGAAVLVMGGCSAAAVLDEFHQSFIPGRTSSLSDVAADVGGSAVVVLAASLLGTARRGGLEVTLIGRAACHLCDEADGVLARVLPEFGLTCRKVGVDDNADLRNRYGDEVPVLLLNGRKAFKYRIDELRLRRMLETRLKRSER